MTYNGDKAMVGKPVQTANAMLRLTVATICVATTLVTTIWTARNYADNVGESILTECRRELENHGSRPHRGVVTTNMYVKDLERLEDRLKRIDDKLDVLGARILGAAWRAQ